MRVRRLQGLGVRMARTTKMRMSSWAGLMRCLTRWWIAVGWWSWRWMRVRAVGEANEMSRSSVSAQRLQRPLTRRERVLWRTVRTVMAQRTLVRVGLLEFLPGPACSA